MTAGRRQRTVCSQGLLPAVVLVLVLAVAPLPAARSSQPQQKPPGNLSSAEFTQLIREVSEEGGYFFSDNLISNETPYLTVVDKLRQLGAAGGEYIGVGPEQNFTYIAKLRPQIAFIVDIRRQAMIQHLMYKAIFCLSPSRLQFLSRWLSKPLMKDAPSPDDPINILLAYFTKTRGDEQTYAANLTAIRKAIQEDFQFPLSPRDHASLEFVYKSFRESGLDAAFTLNGWSDGEFPTLSEVILQPDQNGKLGNFLASREDYDFIRGLHMKNLIIPRQEDQRGALGNLVSMLPVEIPLDMPNPVERFQYINRKTAAMKNSRVAEGLNLFAALMGMLPAPVHAFAGALAATPIPAFNMVSTNVPGPQVPLYAMGKRMIAYYPYVPVGYAIGCGCAIMSYDQNLYFGLTSDTQAMPDVEKLKEALEQSLFELRGAAGVEKIKPKVMKARRGKRQ